MAETSLFERIPGEVRIMIYELILNDNHNKVIQIRNESHEKFITVDGMSRSVYNVAERTLYRPCKRTTYCTTSDIDMRTSIMRVNRKIYKETVHMLYSTHSFSFDRDIEAVVPFFTDLRMETRLLVKEVSLVKDGRIWMMDSDRCQWMEACKFLGSSLQLGRLKLVVEGCQPLGGFSDHESLTVGDFKCLSKIQYEPLDWVWQLFEIKGLWNLEVIPRVQQVHVARPYSTAMSFFIAFSASIKIGFTEFLMGELVGTV